MQITCDFPDNVLAIGTKVFIPRPAINSVQEDEIHGYFCHMSNDEGKLAITPIDYRLTTINLSRGGLNDSWKSNEFFLSYEEAKANAVLYTAIASPEEWFRAIGLKGSENESRTEYDDECELCSCCSVISDIRDILYDLCKTGNMDGVTRNTLADLMSYHEPPSPVHPCLSKILGQLNLVWICSGTKPETIIHN